MFSWVGICALQEIGNSSSLYKRAISGKAFHQSAHPEILGGPSGGVCGCTGLMPGSTGGQVWYLILQESTWSLGP